MARQILVTAVEVVHFRYPLRDIAPHPDLGIPIYTPGSTWERPVYVVRVETDAGVTGEYVGDRSIDARLEHPAHLLLGRNALDREGFYSRARHQTLLGAHLIGLGVLDIALWDLAGKVYDAPLYELLGGRRQRLKAYASTHVGDRQPDGLGSPEAYADLAEHCRELGFPGFKIHPWADGTPDEQRAVVRAVGERVGDSMLLMLDSFNSIPTFGEAVRVGRACDEHEFFWYEDPFRDGGVSLHAHRKLRQLVRTPLLALEHVRGLEAHVDFIEGQGTDFVRVDPDYDGVTGTMKIAHAAEGFGLDAELHGSGPVRRHLMAAMTNTNFYELSLVHPKAGPFHPPVHDGFEDDLTSIGSDGCVDVPDGPGLGVAIDWDFIARHETGRSRYER